MNDSSSPARSYSTADVARQLGVSVPTVQRWVDQGHLKAWKTLGGHRRLDADSADRFIAAHVRGERPADSQRAERPPTTVLIVEDDPDDRDLIGALVGAAIPGASVDHAGNGFEALVAIGQRTPEVVITGLQMPHMDGLAMLRHLAHHSSVRPRVLVAITGQAPPPLSAFDGWPLPLRIVPKPIVPRQFIDTVRAGVAQRQA